MSNQAMKLPPRADLPRLVRKMSATTKGSLLPAKTYFLYILALYKYCTALTGSRSVFWLATLGGGVASSLNHQLLHLRKSFRKAIALPITML